MVKVKSSPSLMRFKKKRELFLTPSEQKKIWGESGPYSEVYLTFENRILDDRASKTFLKVEVSVNPLTFEIIKKYRSQFMDDKRIQDILEHAQCESEKRGYEATLFTVPWKSDILEVANNVLQETEVAIIKMHKFVMDYFDTNTN